MRLTVMALLSCWKVSQGFTAVATRWPVRRQLFRAAAEKAAGSGAGQEHVIGIPRDIISPEFSQARQEALDAELAVLGVPQGSLEADPVLVGSSALKTYTTFVRPREAKMEHALRDPLVPAARRTAQQVAFLARQRRAQHAEWIRSVSFAHAY